MDKALSDTPMKEHPILFSGEMVRAILSGKKTQTRRICKNALHPITKEPAGAVCAARDNGWVSWFPGNAQWLGDFTKQNYATGFPCPYGKTGDKLWVRETCLIHLEPNKYKSCPEGEVVYRADFQDGATAEPGWTPSIFMPRWASRILLEITGIRVERLQEIKALDCRAEGITDAMAYDAVMVTKKRQWPDAYSAAYADLWDSINAKRGYPWASNPWVWVIEFRRVV